MAVRLQHSLREVRSQCVCVCVCTLPSPTVIDIDTAIRTSSSCDCLASVSPDKPLFRRSAVLTEKPAGKSNTIMLINLRILYVQGL